MAGIPWTDKEKEILTKMSERGLTAKDVALVLKSRSTHGINCQAAIMGLSLCYREVEIDEEAFKRLLKGKGK